MKRMKLVVFGILLAQCNYAQRPFITQWQLGLHDNNPSVDYKVITIPTSGGVRTTPYDFQINWGDGSPLEEAFGLNPSPSHQYMNDGVYTVKITGVFPHLRFNSPENAKKLLSIEQWGDIKWESMSFAFAMTENMTLNATDIPNISSVTDMSYMFSGAKLFNGDLSRWHVASVVNMSNAFNGAESFNGNISSWHVQNVTNMSGLFSNATAFNSNISSWDVSNVTDMNRMFASAKSFNGDISYWYTSNVTDMSWMFYSAVAFNQDLSNWDVSNVTNMHAMFSNANAFNGDLGSWDVSNVTDMHKMFLENNSFNGILSYWNVSNVTDMSWMFHEAAAFNGDLSKWDISNVRYIRRFLSGSAMSSYNYDQLLIHWSKLDLQNGLVFDADGIPYGERASKARQFIISNHKWLIGDGGRK